jgi:hypothetical protein
VLLVEAIDTWTFAIALRPVGAMGAELRNAAVAMRIVVFAIAAY